MFKFEINQLVFCVRKTTEYHTPCCEFCGGKGYITGENKRTANCPSCWGSGKGSQYSKDVFKVYSGKICERNFEEKIIKDTFLYPFKNRILSNTTYEITGVSEYVSEKYIFSTEKEANDFAKKLNEDIK